MTHKALIRRLQISCLGLDPVDPLRLLVDDVVAALAQPAQQEPVAWMLDGEFYKTQQFHLQGGPYANQIPLYTAPPQRTWVGLTDEEYAELAEEFGPFPINQIEAKLKEKNT